MAAILDLSFDTRERKKWPRESHEYKVEAFYSWGVERFENFHNGYLNFGLWKDGMNDYIAAATALVHRMGELLGLQRDSILLDIGCGMGSQDIYLHQAFGPHSIDGVDITWRHLEHARRRAREANCQNTVHFHHDTATHLPFGNETFTNLMSIEGAEHCNTRERFLHEAHRVLKQEGVIALADFTLKREPRNLYEKMNVECARMFWRVPRENVYLWASYREKMATAGFRDIDIQCVGDLTIPGYYREQTRPETIRETTRIRGFVAGHLGCVIDYVAYQAYRSGLLEYVLVRAVK